jgi:hydrogenase-4 component E
MSPMSDSTYTTLLQLSVSVLLLSAVLVVWRREFSALVRLLAVQGLALAAIPLIRGWHNSDWTLIGLAVGVAVLRGAVLPAVLRRLLRRGGEVRESEPLVNTTASLLAVAGLTIVAYGVSRPVVALDSNPGTRAAPAALAVVLTGIFVLISRRRALSQMVGFLLMDNGIAAVAFLTTAGVPLVVELGASLDLLFIVLVLQILGGRLRLAFGATDLDELRELRD